MLDFFGMALRLSRAFVCDAVSAYSLSMLHNAASRVASSLPFDVPFKRRVGVGGHNSERVNDAAAARSALVSVLSCSELASDARLERQRLALRRPQRNNERVKEPQRVQSARIAEPHRHHPRRHLVAAPCVNESAVHDTAPVRAPRHPRRRKSQATYSLTVDSASPIVRT